MDKDFTVDAEEIVHKLCGEILNCQLALVLARKMGKKNLSACFVRLFGLIESIAALLVRFMLNSWQAEPVTMPAS